MPVPNVLAVPAFIVPDYVTVEGFRIYLQRVRSSNVQELGHCTLIGKGVMVVRYLSGATYLYRDVPESLHALIAKADSVGKALRREIIGRPEYQFELISSRESGGPCGCDPGAGYTCAECTRKQQESKA